MQYLPARMVLYIALPIGGWGGGITMKPIKQKKTQNERNVWGVVATLTPGGHDATSETKEKNHVFQYAWGGGDPELEEGGGSRCNRWNKDKFKINLSGGLTPGRASICNQWKKWMRWEGERVTRRRGGILFVYWKVALGEAKT